MKPEEIIKILEESIKTGEVLPIIYQGGSEPGAVRNIYPRSIKDGIVKALCMKSNRIKGFAIDKIQLSNYEAVNYHGEQQPNLDPATLQEGIAPYLEEIARLGWTVEQQSQGIELYQYLPGTTLKKWPTLTLVHNPDQELKPWITCGVSFKFFDRAIEKLMARAKKKPE